MKETQHIEFKSKFNEDVIETLVAFANAKQI
jgi:predicted HTH transcriptional regulator